MKETTRAVRELLGGDAVCVLSAFSAMQQSRDGAGPFLQEANFLWLTGIDEPGWRCIITQDTFYLVAPDRSDVHRVFDGGFSNDEVLSRSGADEVISSTDAAVLLDRLAESFEIVYTLTDDPHASHYDFILNPEPGVLMEELRDIFKDVRDCRLELAKVRAIKNPDELRLMRDAVLLTSRAFDAVKEKVASGSCTQEYEVEALFTYEMRRHGAQGHAYEPIVAGGKNALTLHYSKNNDPLPKNGLVLMDIGARIGGYAADITRTFAIGTPSAREKEVHAAVEAAHRKIISLIKPGVSLKDYQNQSDDIMKQALEQLGLLSEPSDLRKYFPHAISHGLGIDVHESLGGHSTFQPGMVLTVEPGIYIPEEGIGVRIEDDILVTSEGNENLSAHLSTGM